MIGTLVLACSTVTPAPAEPTPSIDATAVVEPTLDIDATVEARLAHERAVDAIIKLASALSEEQLRRLAAGDGATGFTVEGESHVVEPKCLNTENAKIQR